MKKKTAKLLAQQEADDHLVAGLNSALETADSAQKQAERESLKQTISNASVAYGAFMGTLPPPPFEPTEEQVIEKNSHVRTLFAEYAKIVKAYQTAISEITTAANSALDQIQSGGKKLEAREAVLKKINSLKKETTKFEKGLEYIETDSKIHRISSPFKNWGTYA